MRWQTIAGGVLGLALLEVAVSSQAAAGRVGGLLDAVASIIARVLSPAVPAIPDLRKKGGTTPTSATTGGSVQPAVASSPTMPPDWTTSATTIANV